MIDSWSKMLEHVREINKFPVPVLYLLLNSCQKAEKNSLVSPSRSSPHLFSNLTYNLHVMISSFMYHSTAWLNIFSLLISTCCVVENSSHVADLLFAIQEISSSAGSRMTGSSESEALKSFNVVCVGGAAEGVVDVELSVLVCGRVVDIFTVVQLIQ